MDLLTGWTIAALVIATDGRPVIVQTNTDMPWQMCEEVAHRMTQKDRMRTICVPIPEPKLATR